MAFPVNEDTTGDENFYVAMDPPNNHAFPWTNDTGADVAKGDVVILGPLVGIADEDIEAGYEGSLNIGDGDVILTAQVAVGSTFVTVGQEVWYDPATGLVQDTSANNLYGLGPSVAVLSDNGVVAFLKRRYWVREAFYAET
jgi:predicted RecA/RadA family phage recombinase